jgi:hypothetical protein
MGDLNIPEEAIEAAQLGAMGYDAGQDDDGPKGDEYFTAQMAERLANEKASVVWLNSGHKWRAVSGDALRQRARDLRASVLRGEGQQ